MTCKNCTNPICRKTGTNGPACPYGYEVLEYPDDIMTMSRTLKYKMDKLDKIDASRIRLQGDISTLRKYIAERIMYASNADPNLDFMIDDDDG